ncbi:unnamed protein product [Lactuca saligna]|uniref:Uncharacterized protein n=1 Tax=Lactuca saligna TaxID=75948 RepID=A0AA35ZFH8_LACSI|nr:unnamed protein product [Lactuca saligna]
MELRKYPYERLDRSIRAEERFAAIRSFSRKSGIGNSNSEADSDFAFVFMISSRAGGVGLNLVAANTVTRERALRNWVFEETAGNIHREFGSGYPGGNNLVERTYESDINGNKFNTRVHTIRC